MNFYFLLPFFLAFSRNIPLFIFSQCIFTSSFLPFIVFFAIAGPYGVSVPSLSWLFFGQVQRRAFSPVLFSRAAFSHFCPFCQGLSPSDSSLMLFSFSLSPLTVSLVLFILMLVAKTDQISSLLCTSSFELNRKINGSTSYGCSSSATVEKRKKSEDGNKLFPIWSVFPSVHHRNDIGASSDAWSFCGACSTFNFSGLTSQSKYNLNTMCHIKQPRSCAMRPEVECVSGASSGYSCGRSSSITDNEKCCWFCSFDFSFCDISWYGLSAARFHNFSMDEGN